MTQDFAKKKKEAPPPTRPTPKAPWFHFVTGFVAGAFVTFLAALWYTGAGQNSEESLATAPKPVAEPNSIADEIDWDFYEIFPKSEVPVSSEPDYATESTSGPDYSYHWLIQAGSFRDARDADELRAQLILLGLETRVQKSKVEGTTWHRVVAGPFDTDLKKNRAQDKLAQAQIESIPIRIRDRE